MIDSDRKNVVRPCEPNGLREGDHEVPVRIVNLVRADDALARPGEGLEDLNEIVWHLLEQHSRSWDVVVLWHPSNVASIKRWLARQRRARQRTGPTPTRRCLTTL